MITGDAGVSGLHSHTVVWERGMGNEGILSLGNEMDVLMRDVTATAI